LRVPLQDTYRSLSLRPQSQSADPGTGSAPLAELALADLPGLYAYEDPAQGARLALRQMQALDALREQVVGLGTARASWARPLRVAPPVGQRRHAHPPPADGPAPARPAE
jgi:hypothetical protein